MPFELRDARLTVVDRAWLLNVYPLYLHDLSEFDPGYYQLDERGVWQPDHLSSWLSPDTDMPLLLVDDGRRIGFAFVNRKPSPHVAPGFDNRMAEFFVLRRHRGQGLGTRAAHAVFAQFPGRWEVSELVRNEAAIRFWRRVVGEHTGGRFDETADADELRQAFKTPRGGKRTTSPA